MRKAEKRREGCMSEVGVFVTANDYFCVEQSCMTLPQLISIDSFTLGLDRPTCKL